MLGALPADEDPIPIPEEGGHPPPFDFFWSGLPDLLAFQPNPNINVE
jgi:hypothetical protein